MHTNTAEIDKSGNSNHDVHAEAHTKHDIASSCFSRRVIGQWHTAEPVAFLKAVVEFQTLRGSDGGRGFAVVFYDLEPQDFRTRALPSCSTCTALTLPKMQAELPGCVPLHFAAELRWAHAFLPVKHKDCHVQDAWTK
jgi:hypothetical protein